MNTRSTPPVPRPDETEHRADTVLPLAIRRRLWEQVWAQLLTPPTPLADRSQAPRRNGPAEGGGQ